MASGTATRYSLALAFVVLAIALRAGLYPSLGSPFPYPIIPLAVMLAAWYCGLGPAVMAAILGYVGIEYSTRGSAFFVGSTAAELARLALIVALNAVMILIVMRFRSELDRLRQAEGKLRQSETVFRRGEAKLKESEHRIQATFDNAAVGITETDADRRFVAVNERLGRMLGYSREELLGMTVRDITAAEDRSMSEELSTKLRDGLVDRLDYDKRYVRRDGSRMWGHVTASCVRDEAGRFLYAIGTIEDVSERKLAHERRIETEESLRAARSSAERARAEAEEANRAKDHFLAVLSHELRTPLTPVLAAVQLIQRRPNLDEELHLPLEIIHRNLQLEARLIDDLLDLTRIVQGKLVLDRKPISLSTVLERAVEIAKPDISARKLHFALDLKDGPLLVNADASRLQQVIWNLLSNAVKFTPQGGCVGLRCCREGMNAVIEVSDSGIGIEPAARDRIFDAFEQGGGAITRQFGGLGLGLAIARKLVQMHEGAISAVSEGRSRGSTFRVTLPISASPLAAPAGRPSVAAPAKCRRILLVEDNGDTAAMMKMLLEAFGYEVDTVGDVAQALTAVEAGKFDLLISDLGLPDRSGIDLMRELRQRGIAIKGVALSGYGREDDVRRSREAGFSVHLTKPVDADALVETVSSIL